MKVLLVEDDIYLISMYTTKFRMAGWEVIVAPRGESTFDILHDFKPDIILLDILLPGMDGFAVLKRLKSMPDMKAIPVVMLTNLGQRDDVRKGIEEGADGYIIKAHYMPSEIVDRVKLAMEQGISLMPEVV
jgi:DNA-binding response OmpR family regulator